MSADQRGERELTVRELDDYAGIALDLILTGDAFIRAPVTDLTTEQISADH